jgi:hypothetical protein
MYQLDTSTGYSAQHPTVERIAAALAQELQTAADNGQMRWSVATPHGTVVSNTVPIVSPGGLSADDTSRQIDRAYALLVRDHLYSGNINATTGLFQNRRAAS